MSNPTEILIEKLKLKLILRERVFIKWEDESGTPCTLGSRSRCNGQNLNFFIGIYYDKEGHLHIHFSLEVSIILGNNKQKIEMLLIVPPDTNFSDTTTPRLISNIGSLSRLDASAIHDAGLSDSVHVICLQFDLITKGLILTKKKNTTAIKPRNYTSKELIRGFESLSDTKTFTVYIKPNDYALVGLEEVRSRLSNTDIPTDIHTIKEIYVEQMPELVEWSRLYPVSLLPSYTKNPQPSPEIQVPLSPIIFEQDTPLITTIKAVIAETPGRTPISPTPTSVHGIFSPSRGELSDGEVNLDDMEKHSRYIEMDSDIDSDEERLASLYSRELSQQLAHDSKVSQLLSSKLLKWMQTAIRINSNIHEHKRLITKFSTLGNCIRTSNATVFDATLLWCSALFFYDPLDSDPDNTLGLWQERNSWLISDIARLIQWANRMQHDVEMNSLLKHFTKLGDTARTVALDISCNKDKYYDQKSACIVCILAEFGKLGGGSGGNSDSKENNKTVCRKRKGLGAHGTTSKLIKM